MAKNWIFEFSRCHYIHINGTGDGDCKSVFNGKRWCYVVGVASGCKDKKKSTFSDQVFGAWDLNEVHYSEDACKNHTDHDNESTNDISLGNEDFLPGFELTGYDAIPEFGGGGIIAPSPEACETECFVRDKSCSGWTFMPDNLGIKSPGKGQETITLQPSKEPIF